MLCDILLLLIRIIGESVIQVIIGRLLNDNVSVFVSIIGCLKVWINLENIFFG